MAVVVQTNFDTSLLCAANGGGHRVQAWQEKLIIPQDEYYFGGVPNIHDQLHRPHVGDVANELSQHVA
tara:strand:- start:722 stop:925 length:204 start_codon:yes stop_codon:yes gene_type:complete